VGVEELEGVDEPKNGRGESGEDVGTRGEDLGEEEADAGVNCGAAGDEGDDEDIDSIAGGKGEVLDDAPGVDDEAGSGPTGKRDSDTRDGSVGVGDEGDVVVDDVGGG
jgi:hypothetical protein